MREQTISRATTAFPAPAAGPGISKAVRSVRALLRTDADPAATAARLALGAMILPHGLQKLVGAFGGYGFEGTMGYFTGTLGFPWLLGFLAIVAESFGGLALIFGLVGRLAALGVGSVMLVAAATHLPNGFFMNWFGALPAGAEGWEFHLLALGLATVVLLRGSGAASLDRRIAGGPRAPGGPATADDSA